MNEVDNFSPRRSFRFLVQFAGQFAGLDFLVQNVNFPSMVGVFGNFRTEYDQPIEVTFTATPRSEILIQDLLNQSSFDVPIYFLNELGVKTGGFNLKSCRATLAPFNLNYKDSEVVKYTILIKSPTIVAMKD